VESVLRAQKMIYCHINIENINSNEKILIYDFLLHLR